MSYVMVARLIQKSMDKIPSLSDDELIKKTKDIMTLIKNTNKASREEKKFFYILRKAYVEEMEKRDINGFQ